MAREEDEEIRRMMRELEEEDKESMKKHRSVVGPDSGGDSRDAPEGPDLRSDGDGEAGGGDTDVDDDSLRERFEGVSIAPPVEDVDDFVEDIARRVGFEHEELDESTKVDMLRKFRREQERERLEYVKGLVTDLCQHIQRCVVGLYASNPADAKVKRLTRTIFDSIVQELVRAGALPTDISSRKLSAIPELRRKIIDFMEEHEDGEGLSKTRILVGIGRNHKSYYEMTDYIFAELVSEGFCEKRGRRFYLCR